MHIEELRATFDRQAAGYDAQWERMAPIRDALYLLVDCKRESLDDEPLSLTAPRFRSGSEPVFQIDGRDLNFLRSIGIDPTRRLRRRRTTAT